MAFLGKWSWTIGADSVQIDPKSGALAVQPASADGRDRFNVYGTLASFRLQASNGRYVALTGATYVADKGRDDPASQFTLLRVDDQTTRVVDLGLADAPSGPRWWNRDGDLIRPVPPTSPPPATSVFGRTEITPGIEAILASGFTSAQPDLSWVYLAGTDFTSAGVLDLTESNLSHADLSHATIPSGTPFQHATAPDADFSYATLTDCQFDSADLKSALFVHAKMASIDLNGADLTGADLTGADLTEAVNLANTTFDRATLRNATFVRTGNIFKTSFVGADLTGVDFTGSSVTEQMDLRQADLTGATLSNPLETITIFPNCLAVDETTNFRRATLHYLDFTGYDLAGINFAHADLTGCKLDHAGLDRTNFGYATLDGASVTGSVSLHGANLANASLRGADLTGAQLGAVSMLFRIGQSEPTYARFLAALQAGSTAEVAEVFAANKRPLSAPVQVSQLGFEAGTAWRVYAAAASYSVFLESVGAQKSLNVYQPTTPAVLTNAFMVDVNLKGANLYGVRASGVHLYATAGRSVNLNQAKVNGLQANNANLGGINLSQANLTGCNFDYAVLTGATFVGATLGADIDGGQSSFSGANLQGADFGQAFLNNSIFANAAVAIADPGDEAAAAGVRLFSLDPGTATLVRAELSAASPDPAAKRSDPKNTFSVPIQLLPRLTTTGPVSAGLIQAFADANIGLAPTALLVVLTSQLYWRVTDGSGAGYSVFRSVSNDYQPALGVATGANYTVAPKFFLPLSIEGHFGNGPATKTVVEAFAAQGASLQPGAQVTSSQHPIEWQVVNGADVYTLWLAFDSSVAGVDTRITARVSIPNVVSQFADASIALSTRAVIGRIADRGFTIDNDSENPFSSARGYIQFRVFPAATGGLDVFGSVIRIVRATGPGSQAYSNIPCMTTKLSALSSATNTVCPNGATVAANHSDDLPFADWLSASYLPRPPLCVPDPKGKFACPI